MESLEFHVEPDYNKCRKMFETALKAAGCKLDGKIDFSTPKKAPKKVNSSSSSPRKRKSASSPRKRKSAVLSSNEDTDESETDESFVKEKSLVKKKNSFPVAKAGTSKATAALVSPPVAKPRTKKATGMSLSPEKSVKKTRVTKAKVTIMKDQECQTSPGFVKAVKAARKKKPVLQNVEMDEFVKESISAAKKVVKKTPAKKSPKKSPARKAKTENGNGEAALSNLTNLTPAMLAVMAKKAESSSAKKPRTKK